MPVGVSVAVAVDVFVAVGVLVDVGGVPVTVAVFVGVHVTVGVAVAIDCPVTEIGLIGTLFSSPSAQRSTCETLVVLSGTITVTLKSSCDALFRLASDTFCVVTTLSLEL